MYFNLTAFVVTLAIIVLFLLLCGGLLMAVWHRWWPMQVVGGVVAALTVATFVAIVAALMGA